MNPFPAQKNCVDVNALATVLDGVAVGATISYNELTQSIGREIQSHRYLLQQALEQLLKQRKVFGCVTGVGLQRLSDSEIVEHSFSAFRKIRRTARKAARRLTSVEWSAMTPEDQQRHYLHLSVLGAIAHRATPSNSSRLTAACANSNNGGLPTAKTLTLLAS